MNNNEKMKAEVRRLKAKRDKHDANVLRLAKDWTFQWKYNARYRDMAATRDIEDIKFLIMKDTSFNSIKSYWGSGCKDELLSLAGEVLTEYALLLDKWVINDRSPNTFPETQKVISDKLSLIRAMKMERDKRELYGKHLMDSYQKGGKDFINDVLHKEPSPRCSSNADKYDEVYIAEITDILNTLTQGKDSLKKHAPKDYGKMLQDYRQNNVSVYRLAQIIKVDRRKLLYLLKKTNFPLLEKKIGRYAQLVNLSLFVGEIEQFKALWLNEKTYRNWIRYLKRKGWSKSRVSHFMKRKIRKKLVPPSYFYLTLPNSTNFKQLMATKKKPIST